MMQFLQMVGAVFVGLFIVVVAVYLWIRWKLRGLTEKWSEGLEKIMKQFPVAGAGMMYVPPMKLQLTPADNDEIMHPQEVELATLEVQNQGFQRGGLYNLGELGGVCRALFHAERKVDAVVYDHPLLNVWVEYCAMFPDDTSIAYSNCQQASGLDRPPGRETRSFAGEQIAALWERFRLAIKGRPTPNATADDFQQRFESAYAQEMQWRIDRGGVTEEEVRRCVEMAGGEFTEDHCEMVQQTWHFRIAQHIDEELRAAFAEGSTMSIAQYEKARDNLVFIHDRTAPMLMQMYLKQTDEEEDDEDDDDEDDFVSGYPRSRRLVKLQQRCQASSPRVVFRELMDAGELESEYELVKEMTAPYPTDVYVSRSPRRFPH